jgi:hypothetical protein
MSYAYTWTDAEQTTLTREDSDGVITVIPAEAGNSYYAAFLASGETAADYVAPPAPPEPTPEEKLAASGLTVDELKALLGL